MNKVMDLTNVVIHCPTEELAKKVLAKAHEMGYKWKDGDSFLDETYWWDEEEDTCYWIEEGQYSSLDWHEERDLKIISAEEFLNDGKD